MARTTTNGTTPRARAKPDPEAKAIASIMATFRALSRGGQGRVLTYVTDKLTEEATDVLQTPAAETER